MADKEGHFEGGRWVWNPEPDAAMFEQRFAEAKKSVLASINDVMNVTRDLVTTEEGKQYIDGKVADTHAHIHKSFNDIISRVREEVEKKRKKGA